MTQFIYTAIDTCGRRVRGQIEAINTADLEMRLRRMELDLIRGKAAGNRTLLGPPGRPTPRNHPLLFPSRIADPCWRASPRGVVRLARQYRAAPFPGSRRKPDRRCRRRPDAVACHGCTGQCIQWRFRQPHPLRRVVRPPVRSAPPSHRYAQMGGRICRTHTTPRSVSGFRRRDRLRSRRLPAAYLGPPTQSVRKQHGADDAAPTLKRCSSFPICLPRIGMSS